jgi:peptidase M28-like protein
VTMQLQPEHAKLDAYLNFDNGSGKIRGVYLQGNDAARPLFEKWLSPFHDMGVTTLTLASTGGTDHLSFDAVGLPGFQFIQDPLDYGTVTHHSDMDTYSHAVPQDLMQASAVIATLVYDIANRDEMFPRSPLPAPEETTVSQVPGNAGAPNASTINADAGKPGITKPAISKSEVAKPEVTKPGATKPAATKPGAAQQH